MKHVAEVSSKKELKAFIDFPHDLYRDDKNYVPELFIAQRDLLTPGKHPFHDHSSVQPFLAYDGNKVVGRIAAVFNNNHNSFNNTSDGFFGFFDCIDDTKVAKKLLEAASNWLKAKGATTIIGPVNFSTNETCGLLVEGYDMPPVVMMTYNKRYYENLLKANDLQKKVDLFAFRVVAESFNDKPLKLLETLKQRLANKNITIRPLNLKNFKQEAKNLREVYNSAWDKNLGFVPMTDKEFDYMAKDLKMIVDPDFCMIAEHEGKIVGFALCIPDINQVLIKIRKGRLFPTGLFKLLTQKKKINAIRVLALGVTENYRKLGIEAVFYGQIIKTCQNKNFVMAECSWTLEHNDLINNAILKINGEPYKRYRIFEKAI